MLYVCCMCVACVLLVCVCVCWVCACVFMYMYNHTWMHDILEPSLSWLHPSSGISRIKMSSVPLNITVLDVAKLVLWWRTHQLHSVPYRLYLPSCYSRTHSTSIAFMQQEITLSPWSFEACMYVGWVLLLLLLFWVMLEHCSVLFCRNALTSLPDGLCSMVHLERLDVSNNLLQALPDRWAERWAWRYVG